MRMTKILSLIAIAAMSVAAFGQTGTVPANMAINDNLSIDSPCDDLSATGPKLMNCWGCFLKLLEDCDDSNPEGDRRQACYNAANNFFIWCLGQVVANDPDPESANRTSLNPDINANKIFDIRDSLQYEIFVPSGTKNEDIVVFLRYFDGNDSRHVQLDEGEFFVFDQTGVDDLILIVLTTDVDVSASNSVGIVTGIKNKGQIAYGFAFSAPVVDSFDIDGNGVFDNFDKVEGTLLYSQDKLDYETLARLLIAE